MVEPTLVAPAGPNQKADAHVHLADSNGRVSNKARVRLPRLVGVALGCIFLHRIRASFCTALNYHMRQPSKTVDIYACGADKSRCMAMCFLAGFWYACVICWV